MTIEERASEYLKADNHIICAVWDAYVKGATDQDTISRADQSRKDIEKLKNIMNRLMLDTKDKAEIIKAMEE